MQSVKIKDLKAIHGPLCEQAAVINVLLSARQNKQSISFDELMDYDINQGHKPGAKIPFLHIMESMYIWGAVMTNTAVNFGANDFLNGYLYTGTLIGNYTPSIWRFFYGTFSTYHAFNKNALQQFERKDFYSLPPSTPRELFDAYCEIIKQS